MTVDVVGLCPNMSHSKGLEIFKKQYENYPNKKVSTEDIGKMAGFVLKSNFFEFDSQSYKQISETVIGTKFPPPYLVFLWTTLNWIFKDARYKTLVLEEIY